MPTVISVRDVKLVAGGGLTITGALTVFRAVGRAQPGIDQGLVLGLALSGVGLWLLWDASRHA